MFHKKLPNRVRHAIFIRDSFTCIYCGELAEQIDHIIPVHAGGSDKSYNLISCCKSCNSKKQNLSLVDFLDTFFPDTKEYILKESRLLRMRKLAPYLYLAKKYAVLQRVIKNTHKNKEARQERLASRFGDKNMNKEEIPF